MTDTTAHYHERYRTALNALNDAQRQAVETTEGPVLVIAGPGTGKTQILTLRIAHILQTTDTAPESILALTFTDSGARAMRDRLRQYLGTDAYRVPIYTFHGFADTLIRSYPDAFPRIVGGSPVTDIERITYLESILDSGGYPQLRPVGNPQFYIRALMGQISAMKREAVTPTRLREIIATQEQEFADAPQYHEKGAHAGKVRGAYTTLAKRIAKNQELVRVYDAYEALLQSERRYDFEDMILETVQALRENEAFLRELQEQYQYVLADEHQDVNESQNQILELLVSYHERPNIFAVGDEKQAIYRFQGASLANFLYFTDRFADTTSIELTDNYRSGQAVLDAAHTVIATDDPVLAPLRMPLTASAVEQATVSVQQFAHEAFEEAALADAIAERVAAGVPATEIAVMVRTNARVEHVAHMLRSRGIPVRASADSDINQHPITQQIRALLAAVVRPEAEVSLATALHAPGWGISLADIQRVLYARSRQQPLAALLTDPDALTALGVSDRAALCRVATVLQDIHDRSATELPHYLLASVLESSGFLKHILEHDPLAGGRVVRRLYDTVERHVRSGEMRTLGDVVAVLQRYEAYGVPLAAPYVPNSEAAVTVMTAHKAKGLEFAVVFVPYCTDATWGGKSTRQQFAVPLSPTSGTGSANDDEQRLFYVVMTRAKTELICTYATQNADGKEGSMSRLLAPLEELTPGTVEWSAPEAAPAAAVAGTVPTASGALPVDTAFAQAVLAERGLSATSVNNYRSSPWTYIYRNLLRWPEVPTLSLRYGTVVHSCLERSVVDYQRTGTVTSASELAQYLRGELDRLPLSPSEHSELHEKGMTELTVYQETLAAQLTESERTTTELRVRVLVPVDLPGLPELPLTGSLDRVDYGADGRITRVVDYKTGAPKTRNQILGKTAQSDDAYYQQLRFYALLLWLRGEHHDDIAYTLSFVRPMTSGKIREETFYIPSSEIPEMQADVVRIATDIASGECFAAPCDPATCDYCDLVAMLRTQHDTATS